MNSYEDKGNKIPREWRLWAEENIKNGSDPNDLIKEMEKAGFTLSQARHFVLSIEIDKNTIEIAKLKYRDFENKRVLKAFFKRFSYRLGLYKKPLLKKIAKNKIDSSLVEMYQIPELLSADECDQVKSLIQTKLRPSTIVHEGDYDKSIRTSSTCDLGHLESSLINEIDNRICDLLEIDNDYSEVTQGQQYEIGEEFKEHHDYFDGSDLLIEKHTKLLGQRTYTVMIYLNNVEKGGETFFPGLNKSFKPIMGKALIWNNLNYDGMPNRNTIHQGKPVITGHKSIITKWFREKKKLNH